MDVRDYIRLQIEVAHRSCDGIISDLTDDLLNWVPPGQANTVSATLAHILGGEDRFIHVLLQDKPRIWDAQGWSEKIGVAGPPRPGSGWEDFKGLRLSMDAFRAYGEAVRAGTRAYLENLESEDLERKVNFAGSDRSVAEVLAMLVNHMIEHSGEIAALKGIQGAKGLPV